MSDMTSESTAMILGPSKIALSSDSARRGRCLRSERS